MIIPNIWEKKNVPNHQPVKYLQIGHPGTQNHLRFPNHIATNWVANHHFAIFSHSNSYKMVMTRDDFIFEFPLFPQ